MTSWEHLVELRNVFLKIIGFFLVAASAVHYFRETIIIFLLKPLGESAPSLQFLSPLDPLYFILTIDFSLGLLISLPFLLILIWRYISPAVSLRWWVPLVFIIVVGTLSFTAAAYSYLLVTPLVLNFMSSIVIPGTAAAFTAKGYLTFFLTTTTVLVLIFQIPVLIFLSCLLKIMTPQFISRRRPYIYLAMVTAAAIITPTTDIITLTLVSIPGVAAVELGIIASILLIRK